MEFLRDKQTGDLWGVRIHRVNARPETFDLRKEIEFRAAQVAALGEIAWQLGRAITELGAD